MKRHVNQEHQWMGSGMTEEQIKGVRSLVNALRYYAQGSNPTVAERALALEAEQHGNHTSVLGTRVTPCQPPKEES